MRFRIKPYIAPNPTSTSFFTNPKRFASSLGYCQAHPSHRYQLANHHPDTSPNFYPHHYTIPDQGRG